MNKTKNPRTSVVQEKKQRTLNLSTCGGDDDLEGEQESGIDSGG